MNRFYNEIDGSIKFFEVVKLINEKNFKLKIDVEKIQIKGPSKNSNYKELIELYEDKKDLISKLIKKENSEITVYLKDDEVIVNLNNKSDWKEYIEFICNNVEKINKFINKENRLNGAVKEKNEKGIEFLNLHNFGLFYLTLVRIFSSEMTEGVSITINPYVTAYKIEKDYFDTINYDISNEIFKEKKEINIQEFTKSFMKSILKICLKKKFNLVEINKIESKNLNINDIRLPKNILLKGVPGTGKSRAINNIVKNYIVDEESISNIDQIVRINIHSASSNSDLMQGIGVMIDKNNIIYKEKKGSILKHILNAILYPNIPFFLILEEVQENNLNELIGDLIFLIEDEKRVNVNEIKYSKESMDIWSHIEYICKNNNDVNYVTIPNLIEVDQLENKKIIIPKNLYILCTTNYREDKKIIEDNLFRRFEVIDVFPDSKVIKNKAVKEFFGKLNKSIINNIEDNDRCLIGHSNWINVNNEKDFYMAFLKLINEFKEIKQIEFDIFKSVILGINLDKNDSNINQALKDINELFNSSECNSYFYLIQRIYPLIDYDNLEKLWI